MTEDTKRPSLMDRYIAIALPLLGIGFGMSIGETIEWQRTGVPNMPILVLSLIPIVLGGLMMFYWGIRLLLSQESLVE